MILVNQGTGSSAEYFTAMLRDNSAATIIGEPTEGSGWGYTNRGIPTFLKNSGARVKIPDCVRLRTDGSNKVAGITPDILIQRVKLPPPEAVALRCSHLKGASLRASVSSILFLRLTRPCNYLANNL